MSDAWREFEKLVSRIEHTIGASGAVVTSPDHVPDTVTGESREVDASIRLGPGLPPVRAFECRDRVAVQDVMWIEQLVTKSRDIGIPIVAVVSSGFTGPAIVKATHYGIQVRTVSEVTDEEIRHWFNIKNIQNMVFKSELAGVCVKPHGECPGEPDWDPEWRQRIKEDQLHALAFVREADGRAFCLEEVIKRAKLLHPQFFLDIPRDGSRVRKELPLDFAPGELRFLVIKGVEVKRLTLTFELFVETFYSPFESVQVYADAVAPVAYAAETEADILGDKVIYSAVRRPGSNKVAIRVEPADDGKKMVVFDGWSMAAEPAATARPDGIDTP